MAKGVKRYIVQDSVGELQLLTVTDINERVQEHGLAWLENKKIMSAQGDGTLVDQAVEYTIRLKDSTQV